MRPSVSHYTSRSDKWRHFYAQLEHEAKKQPRCTCEHRLYVDISHWTVDWSLYGTWRCTTCVPMSKASTDNNWFNSIWTYRFEILQCHHCCSLHKSCFKFRSIWWFRFNAMHSQFQCSSTVKVIRNWMFLKLSLHQKIKTFDSLSWYWKQRMWNWCYIRVVEIERVPQFSFVGTPECSTRFKVNMSQMAGTFSWNS